MRESVPSLSQRDVEVFQHCPCCWPNPRGTIFAGVGYVLAKHWWWERVDLCSRRYLRGITSKAKMFVNNTRLSLCYKHIIRVVVSSEHQALFQVVQLVLYLKAHEQRIFIQFTRPCRNLATRPASAVSFPCSSTSPRTVKSHNMLWEELIAGAVRGIQQNEDNIESW